MKKDEGQGSLIFFKSLMVGVVFRDTYEFFYLHNQGEKKRR